MSIKVGVAGSGSMGRNHARVYQQLEGVELIAVFDQDLKRAQAVVDEFGGTAVNSIEELAAKCQAVSVAVPTVAHKEVGCTLMNLGCDVLIEKPIADSLSEAEQLIETSTTNGRILQIGHIERFNPVLRSLEKRLNSPKFIEAHRLSPFPNRSMDIGVVLDVMIHDLEIIMHLVRSPIKSIDAVGIKVLSQREDIANARIRFENGCVANITASRVSPEKMRKIRVFQDETYLSLDYNDQTGEIFWKDGISIKQEDVAIEKDEPLKIELAEFVKCIKDRTSPEVTAQQGTAALQVALEITKIIEQS